MVTINLLRAQVLIRDEARNRRGLERHRANRFDLESARQVRHSVEALVETLSFIAGDEDFWRDLAKQAHVLSEREIDAIGSFDDASFGTMLVACGYTSPPPPPVEELISDTRFALEFALQEGPRPELIAEARRRLTIFLFRTRRQLEIVDRSTSVASTESIARRVGRVARNYIPTVVGMAAGVALETLLPTGFGLSAGVGLAGFLTKVVEKGAVQGGEKVAEHASDWAVLKVIGDAAMDPDPQAGEEHGTLVSPDDAIRAHLAIARQAVQLVGPSPLTSAPALISEAMSHLQRVIDLAGDHHAPRVLASAARLACEVLAEARSQAIPTDLIVLATQAIDVCVQARGQDSQFGSATYTPKPFSSFRMYDLDPLEPQRALNSLLEKWNPRKDAAAPPNENAESGAAPGLTTSRGSSTQTSDKSDIEGRYNAM